jgi:CRISPR-associated protein Csy1
MQMSDLTERGSIFRSAIAAFIEARREAKLKGKEDDVEASSKYEYATWLANAAMRANAIQLTTHPLKATFPDAKIKDATSPFVQGRELTQHQEVGSHLIARDVLDGTGDAASLGTFKFLVEVIVEGQPIIHWILNDDPDLLLALSPTEDEAIQIASEFKKVLKTGQPPASHFGAKQVYWLIGEEPSNDTCYHLLQPLFSSGLAHEVYQDINASFWEEPNKSSRKAKWDKKSSEDAFKDYRNVVARKLGGTKPQNISQLNSERRGINYMLASLPPKWTRESPQNLFRLKSVLEKFAYFEGVRPLVRTLADFLNSDPVPNMETRERREAIEQALGLQLPVFAASIQARLDPGWTRDPACDLPLCEQLWLDSERVELPVRDDPDHPEWKQDDEAFIAAYALGNWLDEVAGRFANWVNAQLHDAGLSVVGDAEYKHWARQAIVDAAWPVPLQRHAPVGGAA